MLLGNARLGKRVVDVRTDDGVIAEIGSIGSGDVDLAGRWLIPGLWDHHVHFTQWAMTSQRVDLSAATSAAQAAVIVGEAIVPGTELMVGAGFRDSLWADAPSLELLDAVSRGAAVVLVSGDLHSVWLNSAGLKRFGHQGHPTGLISEDAAFAIQQAISTVADATVDAWVLAAAAAAARRGVVGVVDLEMAWNLGHWTRRIAAGHDLLRVEFGVYTEHLDRAIEQGLSTGQRFGELLTMGRYKVITDGSLNTRTAFTHDGYPDGGHGTLNVAPDRLEELMTRAKHAGIESAVHAIGDRANTLALDAFEHTGARGRIEHAQLLSPVDYPRFAALGVEVSVQPEHLLDDRDVADRLWGARTLSTYPFRSLLDAGARLLFGSDAPVAPLDPWLAIAAAVERTRDGREPWHPEQRVSAAEAIAASTRSTIAVGEPADLVVTELDPLAAADEELRRMPVAATLLGGRFTHREL